MASPLQRLCFLNGLTSVLAFWVLVNDTGPERSGHVAAWDAGGQQFLIHGGSDTEFRPDLWAYDAETGTWDLAPQLNSAPLKRGEHVAVWDPRELALWIHGGFDGVTLFNDVWRYSDNRWIHFAGGPGEAPTARSSHVAVWDTAQSAMWLHGGLGGDLQDDLWKFSYRSLSSSSWVQIHPIDNRLPSARAHHAAAWDEINSAMWVHGGYDSQGLSNELWAFDTKASTWSLVSQSGPGLRAYHVAAWDHTNQAIWLHGGLGGLNGLAQRELWRFNILSHSWDLIANQIQDGPVARYYHAAAWDVTSASLWIHGGFSGYSAGICLHDTWRFLVTTTSTTRTTSTTVTYTSTTTSTLTTLTTSSSSATATSTTSTSSSSSGTTYSTTTRSRTSTTSSSITTSSTTSTSSSTSSTTLSTTTTSSSSTSSKTSTTSSTTSTSSSTSSTTLSTTTTSSSSTSSSTVTTSSTTSTSSSTSSITLSTTTISSSSTSSSTATSSRTISSISTTSSSTTASTTLTTTSSTTSSTTHSTSTTRSRTVTTSSKTSTHSTTSSNTRSTTTLSSITSTTSTITRSSSTSSTGTFTTSTSSTLTMTTTACPDLLAPILCPVVGVFIMSLAALLAWRYLRRKLVVVLPPPPPPPPPPQPSPQCVQFVSHPLVTTSPQDSYVLPLCSNMEALTESVPQESRKASSCSTLADLPDLYPRKLSSITPARHVCIDILPAPPPSPSPPPPSQPIVPSVQEEQPAGPSLNLPSMHCCRQLPMHSTEPPLLTPPTHAPLERPLFQPPNPLLDFTPQAHLWGGVVTILDHLVGDLPCLNSRREDLHDLQTFALDLHDADIADMTPLLEALTVTVEAPWEAPLMRQELASRLRQLVFGPSKLDIQKPRPMRPTQTSPSLPEPTHNPLLVQLPHLLPAPDPQLFAPGDSSLPPVSQPNPTRNRRSRWSSRFASGKRTDQDHSDLQRRYN